jgi:hypothetical protein
MNGLLLPILLLAGTDKPNQKALVTHLLPAMIPGSGSERLVVAVLNAKKEIKTQAATEEGLVRDAIKAAKFERPAQLDAFPALKAAYNRLPASVQSTIFSRDDKS